MWVAAGSAFLLGSILDVFDGAIARSKGEDGPRGAFIDSTFDRIAEGAVLAAIALVFADDGNQLALAAVFVALVGSFMTSYARARAEALGLDGTSGLMARAERVVLLGASLLFAPLGVLPCGHRAARPPVRNHRRAAHAVRAVPDARPAVVDPRKRTSIR